MGEGLTAELAGERRQRSTARKEPGPTASRATGNEEDGEEVTVAFGDRKEESTERGARRGGRRWRRSQREENGSWGSGRRRRGKREKEGREAVNETAAATVDEGRNGEGREDDGEGSLRRRHRAKEGEDEGRNRWSRKRQGMTLKLDGGEGSSDGGIRQKKPWAEETSAMEIGRKIEKTREREQGRGHDGSGDG